MEKKKYTVKLLGLTAGQVNKNGRIYTREVLDKAIAEYNANPNRRFGYFGSRDDFYQPLGEISHETSNLRIDENGDVLADIVPLGTPNGKILETVLESAFEAARFTIIGAADLEINEPVSKVTNLDIFSINAI